MLQSTLALWPERLFADHRAPRYEQPRHPCALTFVHHLCPNGQIPVRQNRRHPSTTSHTTEPASYLTPVHAELR